MRRRISGQAYQLDQGLAKERNHNAVHIHDDHDVHHAHSRAYHLVVMSLLKYSDILGTTSFKNALIFILLSKDILI